MPLLPVPPFTTEFKIFTLKRTNRTEYAFRFYLLYFFWDVFYELLIDRVPLHLMEDYNRVFFVCPALSTINVDGLNEYLPSSTSECRECHMPL